MKILLLALILLGCSNTLEPVSIVGNYRLSIINGYSMPHGFFDSGSMEVRTDNSYSITINKQLSEGGTLTRTGATLVLRSSDGLSQTGSFVNGTEILLVGDDHHNSYDFSKTTSSY